MGRARKPESERLTEYVGVPVSPVTKKQLDAKARRAGTKPIPYVRRLIETDLSGAKPVGAK